MLSTTTYQIRHLQKNQPHTQFEQLLQSDTLTNVAHLLIFTLFIIQLNIISLALGYLNSWLVFLTSFIL